MSEVKNVRGKNVRGNNVRGINVRGTNKKMSKNDMTFLHLTFFTSDIFYTEPFQAMTITSKVCRGNPPPPSTLQKYRNKTISYDHTLFPPIF